MEDGGAVSLAARLHCSCCCAWVLEVQCMVAVGVACVAVEAVDRVVDARGLNLAQLACHMFLLIGAAFD